MMQIITFNQIIGCHNWPGAPERYAYLRNTHRHVFHVRCWFYVDHSDRQIEINDMQQIIEYEFTKKWSLKGEGKGFQFGAMSCEDIAKWCVDTFECEACEGMEDGFGGAYVRR